MRQERTARRVKRAAAQAEQVVEQAAQKARRSTAARTATATKAKPSTTATVDPAAECVRLRDEEGLSWVQIGIKLGLPGSKGGAAGARKLYDSTGRDHRSAGTVKRQAAATTDGKPRERKPRVRKESVTAVKKKVQSGLHNVIPLDTPDAEIGAQLMSRLIKWSIDVSKVCGGRTGDGPFMEQEAVVHPDDILIERNEDGSDPAITFREGHSVKINGEPKFMPAAYRTVRLASIHYIGG